MGFWERFLRKNIFETEVDKYRRIAKKIYEMFGFNENQVKMEIAVEKEEQERYGYQKDGIYYVVIGIKELIERGCSEEQLIYFKNTVFHELVHARNYINASEEVREMIHKFELTYAYWARKLVDEYMAYKESNELFPEDKSCLLKSEDEILMAFKHYCFPLKPTFNMEKKFFESYYELGSAFIAHSVLDNEFPHKKDVNLHNFHEKYMHHLKKAADECYSTKKQYEQLAEMLLKDFEVLYRVVKEKPKTDFKYFKINSHMH